MPRDAVPAVLLFIALVLSVALTALAASGHFPPEHRASSLRSGVGRAILFGACAVSALALVVGAAAAWAVLPRPAAVIGSRCGDADGATLAAAAPRRLRQWTRRAARLRRRIGVARARPPLAAI